MQESCTADGRAEQVALACQYSLVSEPQSWNIDINRVPKHHAESQVAKSYS